MSQVESQMTIDHDEIRRWAEQRKGKPATVKRTAGKRGEAGILRIDFPGYSGEKSLEEISWDEFFEKFEESKLALLYQEKTAEGKKSNFNKLVKRPANLKAGGSTSKSRTGRTSQAAKSRSTTKSSAAKAAKAPARAKTRTQTQPKSRAATKPKAAAKTKATPKPAAKTASKSKSTATKSRTRTASRTTAKPQSKTKSRSQARSSAKPRAAAKTKRMARSRARKK